MMWIHYLLVLIGLALLLVHMNMANVFNLTGLLGLRSRLISALTPAWVERILATVTSGGGLGVLCEIGFLKIGDMCLFILVITLVFVVRIRHKISDIRLSNTLVKGGLTDPCRLLLKCGTWPGVHEYIDIGLRVFIKRLFIRLQIQSLCWVLLRSPFLLGLSLFLLFLQL